MATNNNNPVPSLSKQRISTFLVRLMVLLLIVGVGNAQLSPNFYTNCPNLVTLVRTGVRAAMNGDARMGASLLRLHFHDCFVNGCDASILLDDNATFTGEQTAGPNVNSIRGLNVIDTIKTAVERACPNQVSCADILALAAREGTVALRGPTWTVGLGRRDSTTASLNAANAQIPAPTLNLNQLIASFSNKGFSAKEMVALSGSHTIGQARCTTFRTRLTESNINLAFLTRTRARCPVTGGDNNLLPLDETSPLVFNNDYYRNLVGLRGLLHSDQQLFNNGSTDAQVRSYTTSTGTAAFFADFASAMVRMSNLSPLTGTNGQIRRNCGRVN